MPCGRGRPLQLRRGRASSHGAEVVPGEEAGRATGCGKCYVSFFIRYQSLEVYNETATNSFQTYPILQDQIRLKNRRERVF